MVVYVCPMVFASFECQSDPKFSSYPCHKKLGSTWLKGLIVCLRTRVVTHGFYSLISRFPPNFVRQLSTKVRRNCSNIGIVQIKTLIFAGFTPKGFPDLKEALFFSFDGSLVIHAGEIERLSCGIATDAITTLVVNTYAYFFKKTHVDCSIPLACNVFILLFHVGKMPKGFEYECYENLMTVVVEENISALEGPESTLILASGMCASRVMLMALVPTGGHLVTIIDCYRKTRIFIETILPKWASRYVSKLNLVQLILTTVIYPADVGALEHALNENKVSLFFIESPTNPFLRCIDIELVPKLCHIKGALVCIDGTFATPLNQKDLALGTDLVLHSAKKYIGGHSDVLAGCISGPMKLVSKVRNLHHILGGALNPVIFYIHDNLLDLMYIPQENGRVRSNHYLPSMRTYAERLKYGIKDKFVRFSFGVQDFEDLKANILQALYKI
ncbi:hypothetical protein UlMin_021249 [Ulmus minor]